MAHQDLLKEYRDKRNFDRTPEPSGKPQPSPGDPIFMIQKHDASTLHYDFRLEVQGVLKSWAVPKGPSTDPADKRLAVPTEDHPMEYADFEGVIPEGEYGAGAVIVWDRGTYRNLKQDEDLSMEDALAKGRAEIWLEGEKLRGGYALVRTTWGKGENWLLIKKSDEHAERGRDVTAEQPESIISGRTVEQIGGKPTPAPAPAKPRRRSAKQSQGPVPAQAPRKKKKAPEGWQEPMLAVLTEDREFPNDDWLFEPKLDGVRCLAVRSGDDINLYSRNQKLLNDTYPELVDALRQQPASQFAVDGEIVALENGVSSFSRLQDRLAIKKRQEALASGVEVFYYLFDILALDNEDTADRPLRERKDLLSKAIRFDGPIRYSEYRDEDGAAYLNQACRAGWEGLIAKRATSRYVHGRSDLWLKLKCIRRQEFVIGGFTDPQRSRVGFGALLTGYYEDGQLVYAGKVGTGFDTKILRRLHEELSTLETNESPFVEQPRIKGAHWVRPELVAEIGFSEWTDDGKLRHPRFEGLRPDKSARDVIREQPQPVEEDRPGEETRLIGPHRVELTSRGKVFFPDADLTKGDLVDYYERIAETMLPYLEDRPVTLHRFPNGIESTGFFQKQASDYFPEWVKRVTVKKEDGTVTHAVIENAASLVYLANQGTITFHTWLSRIDKLDFPDRLIFDLDPSASGFELVRFAAGAFKEVVEEVGLEPFLMTTGSRGLHVTIPLDRSADFDTVRDFAQDLAALMARRYPDRLTVEHLKMKRGKRLYLDVARNAYAQTAVTPFSVRARPGATVAVPLEWAELDDADLRSDKFTIQNIFERLEARGDPWADIDHYAPSLREARRRLNDLLKQPETKSKRRPATKAARSTPRKAAPKVRS